MRVPGRFCGGFARTHPPEVNQLSVHGDDSADAIDNDRLPLEIALVICNGAEPLLKVLAHFVWK